MLRRIPIVGWCLLTAPTWTGRSTGVTRSFLSGKSRRLARDGVTIQDLFERSIVRLQGSLIARSAYDEIGGHDESLRICMDLDLSFRLFMKFPVDYIDETVFQYRKHDGNTGRNEDLRLMENIRVIEKLCKNYPATRKLLGEQKLARRIAYRYYRLAKGRRNRGHYRDALQAIEKAVSLYPLSDEVLVLQVSMENHRRLESEMQYSR